MAAAKLPAFYLGRWQVNPAADEISLDGKVVKLEPRLMGLLLRLAAHPGEVVSHQTLLDEVWPDVVVSPDSVYQAVGALRRILGDDSREPSYIANVPRRGYRLVAPVTPSSSSPPATIADSVSLRVTPEPANLLSRHTKTRGPLIFWMLLGVAILFLVAGWSWMRTHRVDPVAATSHPAAQPGKSIAVLPFLDMSDSHDQGFFADGMAEEIIDRLANASDLKVTARTSSFYFKNKAAKVPEIARELGVANILEGSVRKSGDHLRITAQLIRADTGVHLWSDTYDGELRDVFKVQDEIADAVVQALQITLLGGTVDRGSGGTHNLEAYRLYIRAASAVHVLSVDSLAAAQRYLDEAIKLDPSYGNARAMHAIVTLEITDFGGLPAVTGFENARQQAQEALKISPTLFYAHAALMYVDRTYDWNWQAAQAELDEMRRLEPSNPDLPLFQGILYWAMGRWDSAERELRLSVLNDPLYAIPYFNLGLALYGAGRFEEADAAFRKTLELNPAAEYAHAYLAKVLIAENKAAAALKVLGAEEDEEARLEASPIVLQAAGRTAEADADFETLRSKFANSSAYYIGVIYAFRANNELAIQWLERARRQHDAGLVELAGEVLLRPLESDLRFAALKRELHLPQ
jgi:TolB-like protein/DNA-binding winged helix-turn-helix (wHTH) protein/tetratricopeptide (TPR) repeat protein